MIKKAFALLILITVLSSCVSRKKLIYFQNFQDSSSQLTQYEPRLKTDDLLLIIVSSKNPEAVKDFNLPTVAIMTSNASGGINANSPQQLQMYLVDHEGNINFPVIGKIKVGGLTRAEALEKLDKALKKYATDAIINMRIMNYKVSVIGEVVRPGTFNIVTERITLPEALSMAGDMTIYGKRDKVLIIREIDGVKTHNYVDMTDASFVHSPFYYLTQNDVVYVEPNKTRINSSAVGPNVTVAISGISLLITIIALATR